MKPIIVSIFMNNIEKETVKLQREVVEKRKPKSIDHISIQTTMSHAAAIDYILNNQNFNDQLQYDAVMFLDIDAIPLNKQTFDFFFMEAYAGGLIGDAQRSNHIENGQHMFAAPSAFALSKKTYEALGKPSSVPTPRGDVGEEITWALDNTDIPLTLLIPMSYDRPVIRMPWETDRSPTWKLADGYPEYGVGTRFGIDDIAMIYHNFQIFHGDHQKYFQQVCREELAKSE